jgi:phenol 2-monooxygenase
MEQVDVIICGSGSAGLCAATWLARYGVKCKVLERRDGPMKMGQADGVQCRTVEIFESFGVGEELLREAYHVLEVNFWADEGSGIIKRTGRAADVQPGLSHQPHVILNQARINGLLTDLMRKYNDQDIDYGYNVTNVEVDSASVADHDAYPVTVTAEKDGVTQTFAAKYALVSFRTRNPIVLANSITGLRWGPQRCPQSPWLQDDRGQQRCRLGRHGHGAANRLP